MQQLLPGHCFIYTISGKRAAGPGKGPHPAGFGSTSSKKPLTSGTRAKNCRFSDKLMI